MSGTYRTTLVYTKDGHYGRGNNARTAAAEMRKIDRRKKRREAGRIKREAMREYEADIADAQDELLQMAMDYESDILFWEELERERAEFEEMDSEEWERASRCYREMEIIENSYEDYGWDY